MIKVMNNIKCAKFYLVFSKKDNLTDECTLGNFREIESGCNNKWVLYSDSLNKLPVDIGNRHDNGDGIYLRIYNESNTVCFETDELSGSPVFWAEIGDCLIIGSSIYLIIKIAEKLNLKLKIDVLSSSEYMVSGYVYSKGKTLLKNVFLLPPKSILKMNTLNGKCEIFELESEPKYSKKRLRENEAPLRLRKTLEKGYKRYAGKKIALLLSGGGSCRILASCAESAGLDIDYFTFGQSTVNDSDFSIASNVAYKFGKKTTCFRNSGENFLKYWEKMAILSNWINDSVWWAGMIPEELFETVKNYDVVIRGDGDGFYGWGGYRVDIRDILHRFEIAMDQAIKPFEKYFVDPKKNLYPFKETREKIIEKYTKYNRPPLELKGILYKAIRECPANAPGGWYFSSIVPIDTPFLWSECINIAYSLPEPRLIDRWVIFEALQMDKRLKNIPYSGSGSWDIALDFYCSGVWEELINYIQKWIPFECDIERIRNDFLKPPAIPLKNTSPIDASIDLIKLYIKKNRYLRKLAIKLFPYFTHSSMSERFIVRLAMISNLNKLINETGVNL